ncbi:MAG: hypothetical protein SFT90_02310 [Rickettsiales bacterium]|nr:hypothetical protein [Rickettsiales bacterium]
MEEIKNKLRNGEPLTSTEALQAAKHFSQLLKTPNYQNQDLAFVINSLMPFNQPLRIPDIAELNFNNHDKNKENFGLTISNDPTEKASIVACLAGMTEQELQNVFLKFHIFSGNGVKRELHDNPEARKFRKIHLEHLEEIKYSPRARKKITDQDVSEAIEKSIKKHKVEIKYRFFTAETIEYFLKNADKIDETSLTKFYQSLEKIENDYVEQNDGKVSSGLANSYIARHSEHKVKISDEAKINLIKSFGEIETFGDKYWLHQFLLTNVSMPKESYDARKGAAQWVISQITNVDDFSKVSSSFPKQSGNLLTYMYENWEHTTDQQNLDFAKYIHNLNCQYFGIDPVTSFISDPQYDGKAGYSHDNNKFTFNFLNIRILSSNQQKIDGFCDFIGTIFHETNHHFQHVWANKLRNEEKLTNVEANFARLSQIGYKIYPESVMSEDKNQRDDKYYFFNPLEKDSFFIDEYVSDALLGYFLGVDEAKKHDKNVGIENYSSITFKEDVRKAYQEQSNTIGVNNHYSDFFPKNPNGGKNR